jgi:mitotic spindle assembly checkpoint protein MAD2B
MMQSAGAEEVSVFPLLLDFIEACVHTILYAREIYPPMIFEQRARYGVNVFHCRHPDVDAYIRRVLDNTKGLLELGLVEGTKRVG